MLKLFRQKLLVTLALALLVYVATQLGMALAIGPARISPAWPTSGLALALLMIVGRRAVAGLALGMFCANWFLFVGAAVGFDARSALAALVLTAGGLGEAGFAARWLADWPDRLRDAPVRQTLRFARIVVVCCLVGCTVGEATLRGLQVAKSSELFFGWITWWLGDVTGMLVVAPPLLLLLHRRLRDDRLALQAFPLLCLGLGLTLFTTFAVSIVERDAREERFAADAGRVAMALQNHVDLADRDLETLQRYFYGVDIDVDEFRAVSRPLLERSPWQSTFAWLPHVTAAQRDGFETSPQGLNGESIRQVADDGSVVRAALRAEYFPIAWTDPEAGREALIGIDHLADPGRGAALARARASGNVAAAPPLASVAISPEARVVQTLYAPIGGKTRGAGRAFEPAEVRGVVAAAMDVAQLVNISLRQMGVRDETVLLYDPDAPASPALVWSPREGMRILEPQARDELVARLSDGVTRLHALHVADRQWTVVARPAWASTMPQPSWLQLAVLGSGLAFTSLLTGFLVVRRRRDEVLQNARRQLEHEVQARTQDLASTNQRLVEEIEGHRRTEALLQTAQEHAEAGSRAKSQFLANMSHEIRTPLNAVLGYAQLLIEDRRQGSEARERLQIILAAGNRLLGLINDVLDLAKIEAGGVQVHEEAVDLRRELEEIGTLFAPRAEAKGLWLRSALEPGGAAALLVDRAKFGQIVLNLLGNALKFTDHGGITLRAWRAGGDTVVEVEDTGPGMSEAELREIFTPFRQGSAGHAKGGTGLGLSLSRNLAQALGGDLVVASTPGRGTTVRLRLPMREAVGHVAPAPVFQGRQRLAPGTHCRVLVVEDDDHSRDVLVTLLRRAGCEVQEAEDGQAGLDACRAMPADAPFDIVFSDIRMPRLDGLQMLRLLQEDPRLRDLPLIAVSASSLEHERRFYVGQGFRDFVSKPYDFEAIYAALVAYAGARLVPAAALATEAPVQVPATGFDAAPAAAGASGTAGPAGQADVAGEVDSFAAAREHLRALAASAGRGAVQPVRQGLATLASLGPRALPADLRGQLEADLRAYDFAALEARVRAFLEASGAGVDL
jgi:signal transduction histidine kinase/DNA-binding NarL/FixJ family response regulator